MNCFLRPKNSAHGQTARRLRNGLLASTALTLFTASGALAQTVVTDGQTLNDTNLVLNDGGTLTVESGGTVNGGADPAVTISLNAGASINNAGLINGTATNDGVVLAAGSVLDLLNSGLIHGGTEAIYLSTGAGINSLQNAGGSLTGAFFGIYGDVGSSLTNVINNGLIAGSADTGIFVPVIDGLSNLEDGHIYGLINGIYSGGTNNLINAGEIVGGDDGLVAEWVGNSTNAGLIQGTSGTGINTLVLENFTNQSGGVVNGGDYGIVANSGGTSIDGLTNAAGATINGGIIGIYVLNGDVVNLNNLAGGTISGASEGIVLSGGLLEHSTNSGTIEGVTGYGIDVDTLDDFTNFAGGEIIGGERGIYVGGDASNIFNHGLIAGGNQAGGNYAGIYVAGNLTNLVNTGVIQKTYANNGGSNSGVYSVGTLTNLINSGTILASNAGTGDSYGVSAATITSLTNSGKIFADLGVDDYAVLESGGGDTNFTLLPGSVIQGLINLGNIAFTDNLYVGNGLNLATTFQGLAPPDLIETYGALSAVSAGINPLVAVADTSVLAAQDNAMSETTGAISGVLSEQLDMKHAQHEQNYWLKGFGGISRTNGSGPAVAVNHLFGGAMVGADTMMSGIQLGLFGGFSAGVLDVAVTNGSQAKTRSYFGGAYGRFDADAFYVDFGLTAGVGNSDSTRIVANNLVLGGLETATANYNSYFVAPEVTIGSVMDVGGQKLKPSATVRYGVIHSDGYTETGTAAPLTLSGHTSQVIDARLQLAIPMETGPATMFELKAGVDGRLVVGNNTFDATLLGTTTTGFNPGGAQSSVGGFVGADFSHAFSDTATLFASTEIGMGTETAFRADAEVSVKVSF